MFIVMTTNEPFKIIRDSWGYGAVHPSSGTAAVLQVASSIAGLLFLLKYP
jgi:hypothetical protein